MNNIATRGLIAAALCMGLGGLGIYSVQSHIPAHSAASLEPGGEASSQADSADSLNGVQIQTDSIDEAADNTYNSESDSQKDENKPPADGKKESIAPVHLASEHQTKGGASIPDSSADASRSGTQLTSGKYNLLSKNQGVYGQFAYRNTGGGRIEIDPRWVEENIVTVTLPGLNQTVQVNKAARDKFIQAFTYIKNGSATLNGKRVPLLSLIKSMDGTFVPRHVNWNASNGLSNHSWGIAIDINAGDHFRYVNPDSEPDDPNLILWEKAFKPAGFSWGNSYSDSMHFELTD